jgi:hypothetical protein
MAALSFGSSHHATDLVYGNSDLIGRVSHIDVHTWSRRDLSSIVTKGFEHLDTEISSEIQELISAESVGLPFLLSE